jgi:hypothetical protein
MIATWGLIIGIEMDGFLVPGLLCLCFFIVFRRKVFASVDTIFRDCFKNERVYSDSWSRFAKKVREVENLLTVWSGLTKKTNEQAM